MKRIILSMALVLLLTLFAVPVYAVPALPHAFYGGVEINNSPAPDGGQVSATVESGDIVVVQNPVTTKGGSYGIDSPLLLVQGDGLSGAITFYVKGYEAVPSQTVTFEIGGGPTRVDLSVTITKPKPRPTGGGAAPSYTIETDLFGKEGEFNTSSTGKVSRTVEVTSEDGMLTITVPKGTFALDKHGRRLRSLQAAVDESPPDPPEEANIIGLAYDFGPAGATFSPPITFTWTYNLKDLPKGVDPEDLVLAYYNEDAQEWVELDCVVDTKDRTVTASVAHFTVFAIIGKVVELPPEPVVEPVPEPELEVVEPEPAPVPEPVLPAPPPPAPPAKPPFNWLWVIVGVVVVVVGLLIYFLVRRRGYLTW